MSLEDELRRDPRQRLLPGLEEKVKKDLIGASIRFEGGAHEIVPVSWIISDLEARQTSNDPMVVQRLLTRISSNAVSKAKEKNIVSVERVTVELSRRAEEVAYVLTVGLWVSK